MITSYSIWYYIQYPWATGPPLCCMYPNYYDMLQSRSLLLLLTCHRPAEPSPSANFICQDKSLAAIPEVKLQNKQTKPKQHRMSRVCHFKEEQSSKFTLNSAEFFFLRSCASEYTTSQHCVSILNLLLFLSQRFISHCTEKKSSFLQKADIPSLASTTSDMKKSFPCISTSIWQCCSASTQF